MRLLLDTHILLWWLADSPSLSDRARELIADPDNSVFVSAVSLWEIWLKQSLGKLKLPFGLRREAGWRVFRESPAPRRPHAHRGYTAVAPPRPI